MALPLFSIRTLCVALIVIGTLVSLTFLSSLSFRQYAHYPALGRFLPLTRSFCSPESYAAGHWTPRPNSSSLASRDGVLAVSGFEGCASSREVGWHLGTSWGDEEEFVKLQWRGNASSYDWVPGEGCSSYTKVDAKVLVQQLVEEGGWFILGGLLYGYHPLQNTNET